MTASHEDQRLNLLTRLEWLQMHGFVIDPFTAEAFQAETDSVLLSAFVDPPNYEDIRGKPDQPGYRFIFASSGGGKSSLRRRIKQDFDDSLAQNLPGSPRVLTVEYIGHDYPLDEVDAHSHVARIVRLVAKALEKWSVDAKIEVASKGSACSSLRNTIAACRSAGLDGVCILIDNIDVQYDQGLQTAFSRIQQLAARYDVLSIENAVFKFMLPMKLLSLARQRLPFNRFPFYMIRWDGGKLRTVLRQRLVTCSEEPSQDLQSDPLSQLCDKTLSDTIGDSLTNFGSYTGHPRAMLQLGYYLLEEYFSQSENNYRRSGAELINRTALLGAHDRIIETTPVSIGVQVTSELEQKIKHRIAGSRIEDALELFKEINEVTALLLQSRMRHAEEDYSMGIITRHQCDVERNKVIETLLMRLAQNQNLDVGTCPPHMPV